MGKSSAERAAQFRSPGAGVARQGAARARWRAEMLATLLDRRWPHLRAERAGAEVGNMFAKTHVLNTVVFT